MFSVQSTIRDYIRAEGDFHKEIHSWKDQWGRYKTERTEWERGELSGEFMEWNTVERTIKTEIGTRTEWKGVGKLGWFKCLWHKLIELAHSFLFCACVYFCLYGPFNCISFHKFSRQLSAFLLSSSGLLVLSSIYLFMKVSLSPDIILCGWPGLEHQLTN